MAIADYIFKVLIIGDASGSKHSFVRRYSSGLFNPDRKLSIGVEYYLKTAFFKNKEIKLQIWELGIDLKLPSLFSQYCKDANGAFFIYDITNIESLENLVDWIQMIRENAGDIPIILIGSKSDLYDLREVSYLEGIRTATKYNLAAFLEVSAKSGENVIKAFEIMIKLLINFPSQNTIEILNNWKI
ncbi:MAG: Rab family GTPase [Promethearchaeota archaeon]